jgi:hypothetical protein
MNFDHINFIEGAASLSSDGVLPDRGDVSSYWTFATPGTAWLMVPGMLVFRDPRLYESVGSATLFVGTLIGLFLLTRRVFGVRCAYLTLVAYGLSRNGLFNAGSLWSIGNPFFSVWMVYFCVLWVNRNDAVYLTLAIVTWAVGMYVDMVLAPALFMLPAIWMIYRSQIRLAPLVIGACTVLAVWYPFLKFETTRDFADLKSIVALKKIQPADYKASWCVPELTVQKPNGATINAVPPLPPQTMLEPLKERIRRRATPLKEGLLFNFDQMTWTPLAALPLLALGMITLGVIGLQRPVPAFDRLEVGRQRAWIVRSGWACLVLALCVNEILIARALSTNGDLVASTAWTIRTVQACFFLAGLMLLVFARQAAELRRDLSENIDRRADSQYRNSGLFAVSLLVPWLVLMVVAEPGHAVRYFWIWPLQLVLVIAAVTYVPERLKWPPRFAILCQVTLITVLLTHPWFLTPVREWIKNGWSGPMASDVQAADYIGSRLQAEGRQRAAVGYLTYIAEFMPAMNITEPRYKVGAELDMFLKYRYGILNTNQCAEGFSSDDEYRIVQAAPTVVEEKRPESWMPLGAEVKSYTLVEHFDVPPDPRFHLLKQFGDFAVFQRSVADVKH